MDKKDLGIKVVSKEEEYWLRVSNNVKNEINSLEEALKFQKAVKQMIDTKLLKFKR